MLIFLTSLLATLPSFFRSRAALELENLALRQQISVLQRSAAKRPRLTSGDRLLWICLSRLWRGWRSALAVIKPETVVAWHRAGFRLFWTWKVRRGQPGRPVISRDVRDLIRKMCRENPTWGAPRIHGELLKLGIRIAESSVSKYVVRRNKPPSQTWRTLLENHAQQLVSIDFFTVPTIRFQLLYVFLVLAHDRRRILHFNVSAHPTPEWVAQQLREAFPFAQLPRYLLRDRDAIFGHDFREQVRDMGICEVLSAPRSPWQRAYVERVIGSIRRECLDHVIVLHERSLRRILKSIASTIIDREPIFRWGRTHRSHERFSRRKWAPSWQCRSSVGCITATKDRLPEPARIDHATHCLSLALGLRVSQRTPTPRNFVHQTQDRLHAV